MICLGHWTPGNHPAHLTFAAFHEWFACEMEHSFLSKQPVHAASERDITINIQHAVLEIKADPYKCSHFNYSLAQMELNLMHH